MDCATPAAAAAAGASVCPAKSTRDVANEVGGLHFFSSRWILDGRQANWMAARPLACLPAWPLAARLPASDFAPTRMVAEDDNNRRGRRKPNELMPGYQSCSRVSARVCQCWPVACSRPQTASNFAPARARLNSTITRRDGRLLAARAPKAGERR